jgi:hypothetical protein
MILTENDVPFVVDDSDINWLEAPLLLESESFVVGGGYAAGNGGVFKTYGTTVSGGVKVAGRARVSEVDPNEDPTFSLVEVVNCTHGLPNYALLRLRYFYKPLYRDYRIDALKRIR